MSGFSSNGKTVRFHLPDGSSYSTRHIHPEEVAGLTTLQIGSGAIFLLSFFSSLPSARVTPHEVSMGFWMIGALTLFGLVMRSIVKDECPFPWKEGILYLAFGHVLSASTEGGVTSIFPEPLTWLAGVGILIAVGCYLRLAIDRHVWEPLASALLALAFVGVLAFKMPNRPDGFPASAFLVLAFVSFVGWMTVHFSSLLYRSGFESLPED